MREYANEDFKTILCITIDGRPESDSRPRQGRTWSGRQIFYDPKSVEKKELKKAIEDLLRLNFLHFPFYQNIPLSVTLNFSFRKSNNCKDRSDEPHTKKPDIDNLEKYYLDVMNKTVYDDDSRISSVIKTKIHGDQDKVEIIIEPLVETESYKIVNIPIFLKQEKPTKKGKGK